jgi:hypothetical protein
VVMSLLPASFSRTEGYVLAFVIPYGFDVVYFYFGGNYPVGVAPEALEG